MEIQEVGVGAESSPPSSLTVAVAISGTKNSRYALKWALEKFVPEGRTWFWLIHVRSKITMVPTPMGNYLPISKVRDDVASAYRKEVEWKTNSMLLPYKKMCAQRRVKVEAVVIESDDVAEAILGEVAKFTTNKLVIGASSRNIFTRQPRGSNMSSKISLCIPSFCTVYVVSKGKLSSVRASTSGADEGMNDSNSIDASPRISSHSASGQSECAADTDSTANLSLPRALPIQQKQALPTINQDFVNLRSSPVDTLHSTSTSLCTDKYAMSLSSNISDIQCSNSTVSSYRSSQTDQFYSFDQDLASDSPRDCSLSQNEVINHEVAKLRSELRHLQGLCDLAQNESIDASRKLNELSACRTEEGIKLKEIRFRGEKARTTARQERENREAAEREAEILRECAVREALQRKNAEETVVRVANEKERLEKALTCNVEQYKKYAWEEIESATSSFSESLRIGWGANGIVYKGSFHHTVAAVKVLHSDEGYRNKQFKQELEILGRIHHPHLLLLLGACPDKGCLVYEYMENGSLDDRLQCKNNTPPLPWYHRYRIAWEVASALAFLHSTKPEPIVHRDLKPANILLDQNNVSKIGDVGLSTLLPTMNAAMSTIYKDTAPVGTFFYIDPEYQRTGSVSPKSDTYALGMVILQLLTAKPPMGLAHVAETAVEDGCLADVLDSSAGKWPMEETLELALLGLSCIELRRKDRPDLKDQVLPVLEKLKGIADTAQDLACCAPFVPPNHFICPILQVVMNDPCVASDGYTYDRKAIETWFSMKDKSPLTNLQVPNKILTPNQPLLSAIKDWKSRTMSIFGDDYPAILPYIED